MAIIGGAQKLYKAFLRDKDPVSVITYSDLSKFYGNVYIKLGFNLDSKYITPPNYVWVRGNEVLSRYQTQKSKLIEHGLDKYGETELEIMENLGYDKIYDCGNLRLIWTKYNTL